MLMSLLLFLMSLKQNANGSVTLDDNVSSRGGIKRHFMIISKFF